jgi:hypothetical protein
MNPLYTSVEIVGGIGNQLFQLAYIIYFLRLSKTQRIKRKLVFKGDNPYWDTIFKGLFRVIAADEYDTIQFTKYHDASASPSDAEATYCEPPYKSKEHVLLKGKYQTFQYIDDSLRDKLVNIVYSNEDIMYSAYYKYRDILDYFGKNTKDDDMVSLHILRHPESHTPLLMRYYKDAMRLANKKKIVVFSDDIAWCINNFGDHLNSGDGCYDATDYNIYYVKDVSNPEMEFVLMSMFQNNIIADSYFSLWASFISYYKKKIVIAPKHEHSDVIYHKYITDIL